MKKMIINMLCDSQLAKIKDIEENSKKNQNNLEEIKTKISGLEFFVNENKNQINNLQRESLQKLEEERNKLNSINETKYKELIQEQQNKTNFDNKKIEELNIKEKENMEKIEKELKNLKEEQFAINKLNENKIEELDKKLKEKNENIINSELNDDQIKTNKNFDDKIANLEKNIGSLNSVAKKISELSEQNQEKVNNDIKAINDWMNDFSQTVQKNLKNLKTYIDKRLNNLSASQINQINTESNQNNEI